MEFANLNNQRTKATKGAKDALCPCCNKPVIAKCGEIKIWHWAHVSLADMAHSVQKVNL